MAISDKLNYLIETKQLFKDRLNSLGAEITSSTTFRNYLTWLDTFYGEVSNKTDISTNGVVGRTSQESTTGKNLLSSIGLTTQTIDGVTFTPVYENNLLQYIQANGTATNGINYYIQNNYTLNETGTFYITDGIGVTGGENNNTFFIYCGLGASGRTDTNNGQFTVSDASIKSDIRIVVRSGVALNNIKFYPMISKVINDTYEPYTGGQPSPSSDYPQPINNLSRNVAYKITTQNGEQTFTIPLGDIELCNIATYEDKIYSSNGRIYLNKNIGKVTLNGSENWIYTSGLGTIYSTIQQNFDYGSNNKYYANYFLYGSNDNKITLGTSGSTKTMYMKLLNSITDVTSSDTTSTIVEKIKSWLSTHNTIVYYVLNTSTTTEITQENYPALYNALKQIQDYLTAYKINKEFILGYSSPEIEY